MLGVWLMALLLCTGERALAQSNAAAPAEMAPSGNAARGAQLAYTCLGCHGIPNYENAYPMYRVPKLAGQHPEYVIAALQGYRDGDRAHATMHAQASSLSDADIGDIAAYLAAALPATTPSAARGSPPATAQVCIACHGTNGVGLTAQYPSLAGQYDDYVRRALNEYRQGARKNPIMANFASQLKDQDIAELAAYYSQQPSVLGPLPKRWSILSAVN